MNAYLKKALAEKMGTSNVNVDCGSMCNGFDYKIGNKYVTVWHVDSTGRKHDFKRVEITGAVAEELAKDISNSNYSDAKRCCDVVGTVAYFYGQMGCMGR